MGGGGGGEEEGAEVPVMFLWYYTPLLQFLNNSGISYNEALGGVLAAIGGVLREPRGQGYRCSTVGYLSVSCKDCGV